MGVLARLLSVVSEMTSRLDWLAEHGLESWVEELAALHALQVQAQALLDIVVRLAAELGYAPATPREAAGYLAAEGMLTPEEHDFVRRVAGFRNIVVHEYAAVDSELVRAIIEGREYRRVALLAARLVEEATRRGLLRRRRPPPSLARRGL